MFESPRSLTATIYVRFNYKEPDTKPPSQGATETMAKILDQASDMDPVLREILVQFADFLNNKDNGGGGEK